MATFILPTGETVLDLPQGNAIISPLGTAAIGPESAAGPTPPTFTGTINNQSDLENSPITPLDITGEFTDGGGANPIYSMQAGTLPTGITLSSAGVFSGTPTTVGTATGLVVRLTTDEGFADSNTFQWEITAAKSGTTGGDVGIGGTFAAIRKRSAQIIDGVGSGEAKASSRARLDSIAATADFKGTITSARSRLGILADNAALTGVVTQRRTLLDKLDGDIGLSGQYAGAKVGQKFGQIRDNVGQGETFGAVRYGASSTIDTIRFGGVFAFTGEQAVGLLQGDIGASDAYTALVRKIGVFQGAAGFSDVFTGSEAPTRGIIDNTGMGDAFTATRTREATYAATVGLGGRYDAIGESLALFGTPSISPALSGTPKINEV